MTNFDFLKNEKDFEPFANVAISAERLINIDVDACVFNCRRAMEFAIKWMYSVDKELVKPYDDSLACLMNTEEFRNLIDGDIFRRLDFIRKVGNSVAHSSRKITRAQAELCLENLFIFLDFVAYCYADEYKERAFDRSLFAPAVDTMQFSCIPNFPDLDFKKLLKENERLKPELTARREQQQPAYVTKPLEISEFETRKLYIDAMLTDAGWIEGQNWLNEVELEGMPNASGKGSADYVLYGDDGRALAIIEAKRTCADPARGRQQAKLYADALERKHHRRPVIFLTNGFETRIDDGQYPERKVSGIYSKRDLEKWFNLKTARISLNNISVDERIAGRYYQVAAIKAVCEALDKKNRRKALLVMATGSGKTRTVIALAKVLLRHGWIKNILFLADRTALVNQAKRSFGDFLGDELSVSNLCENKNDYSAHGIFSTYQTMTGLIDSAADKEGKIFSCGHFDLIICDEAHRSIYNKYKDIFTYFDAPLIGLTATPKNEVEKNTYEIFELENDVPTYAYDLKQAVKDGYLVDYLSIETALKFIEQGIVYEDLSAEDKTLYETTFKDENGILPESISSSALNEWVFNKDTIKQVLNILMTNGQKIEYGQKLGKTIIFAKNHAHAEKIAEVFYEEYPQYKDYAKVIDNYTEYAQSAIDDFSDSKKLPQIAISVDMLDTGIDIPEILNLVFFKKVMSKAKFWQMIGRGTRLCEGLIDGVDKSKFYIFDFCGNFEFFGMNKGKASANQLALQSAIFKLKTEMIYKLQDIAYQTEELIPFRKALVNEAVAKVKELNRDNFAVRQHLKYVEMYSDPKSYDGLTYEDTLIIADEIAPLIIPDGDDVSAVRFDALMYGIELAYLAGKKFARARNDLYGKVSNIAGVANIPEIMLKKDLIEDILYNSYLDGAGINEFEHIRTELRGLMKFIPHTTYRYDTDFEDDILSMTWNDADLDNDELKNYKAKAEYYVLQHRDSGVIAKLRTNEPLNSNDIRVLEELLWNDIGTKQEYEAEYGEKPLGEFVREIVGLDMKAAKAAFAGFINNNNLDSRQIYFVNQIVEYIIHNGLMKDFSVLQDSPFTDQGSIVEVFKDVTVWLGIKKIIDNINANALAA